MKTDVRRLEGGGARISIGRDVYRVKTQPELDAFWAGVRMAHAQISADLLDRVKAMPGWIEPDDAASAPASSEGDD